MKEYFNTAFCLDGLRVSYEDLSEVAYSLVKEGEPFEKEIGDFLLDWISDESEILQHTSGSTGEPKPVRIAKLAMARSALATGEFLGLREGARALLCLPVAGIAGKMMLVRAMVLGWKLYLAPPSGNPLEALEQDMDFASMVPLQLYQSREHLDRVSTVLVGGGPISPELEALLPGMQVEIYESYGMTETASHVALRKLAPPDPAEEAAEKLPPFRALPGITFGQDKRGCLVIDAPYLSGEPIVTNDLVALEGEDRFRWLGRADHVVNSGGKKLIPEQLEARLGPLMRQRFFLAGLPDARLGEKLVLVVEGSAEPDLLQTLRDSAGLKAHEVPREVFSLPEFALTETGKLDRPETLKRLPTN